MLVFIWLIYFISLSKQLINAIAPFYADVDAVKSISGWQNENWVCTESLYFLKVTNGWQVVWMQRTPIRIFFSPGRVKFYLFSRWVFILFWVSPWFFSHCRQLDDCEYGSLLSSVTCAQAVEMSVITVLFKTLLNQTITPHVYKPQLTLLGSSDLPCTFSWYTSRLWPFFLFFFLFYLYGC